MKKNAFFALIAMLGMAATAGAADYLPEATLDYPSGFYASFPPGSVTVTYDNQPIRLIDPHFNDWDEECVTVYVRLGEGEQQQVDAVILTSFGNPEDPEDQDFYGLDIALYDLDDLWTFEGKTISVEIPEGVVENYDGDINPAQEMVFHLMPTYMEYTFSPDSGATLEDGLTVKVDFGGNPIERLQAEIEARTYEPTYRVYVLEFGKDVTVNEDNELLISMAGLPSGYYELVIPEGYMMIEVEGEKFLSPDIWLEYDILNDFSGIGSVTASDCEETVYTLHGLQVKGQPAKGIFIVNGKKVVR